MFDDICFGVIRFFLIFSAVGVSFHDLFTGEVNLGADVEDPFFLLVEVGQGNVSLVVVVVRGNSVEVGEKFPAISQDVSGDESIVGVVAIP